jgi:hypothetical protein
MDHHAESLDTKAGVVLGFAGILVGLGATAQPQVSSTGLFRSGLLVAVLSGVLAVLAFLPRKYPVIETLQLRQRYLTAPAAETRLYLLDTQIKMVGQAADLVKRKGRRLLLALAALAVSVGLVMAGTLVGTGGHHA